MVQAMIELGEKENRILTIIKGKFGLKNRSEAISLLIKNYEESLEPELRLEYIERLEKLDNEKVIKFKNIHELRKIIEK
jgi:hypothetical protein